MTTETATLSPPRDMPLLTRHLMCQECGEVLMKSPSGDVCPNGHGKIHRATIGQLRTARRHKWSLELPEVKKVKSRYEHDGREVKIVPFDDKSEQPNFVPTGETTSTGFIGVLYGERVRVRLFEYVQEEGR